MRLFLMLVGVLGFTSASAAEKEPPKLLPITPVGPGLHLALVCADTVEVAPKPDATQANAFYAGK